MFEFRRATQSDAPIIAALEEKYIECPWSEEVVKSTIADELSALYMLCDGASVLGYGGIKTVLDTAEIYNIAVDERYRRQGHGARILRTLLRRAADCGAKEVFLEVSEHNAIALALYRAHGFATVARRKNYYASGDALVMRLNLRDKRE